LQIIAVVYAFVCHSIKLNCGSKVILSFLLADSFKNKNATLIRGSIFIYADPFML
jgi:hypothetical protein